MVDLLADKIYVCRTVRINRRGFPDDLKGRLRLQRGQSRTRERGSFTASVWQDKKPVAFPSTLSDPRVPSSSDKATWTPGAQDDTTQCGKQVQQVHEWG